MEIEDLYNLIPDFICTPGCRECCKNFGVPSRTQVEDERVKAFLREHKMQPGQAKGGTCPYLNQEGCSIYPVRPLICRLYGTSPNYMCTMDVAPIRFLHEDEEAEIFYLYQTHFFNP
jgi:Fe-S-cluster containining protein